MVTDPLAQHGEGVIWDKSAGVVRWVDLLRGDILTLVPATGNVGRLHVGPVAAAMRPRRTGGLVIALERGFGLLDPGSDAPTSLGDLWTDSSIRMNDGGCDPQGRFYCGSMAYDASPGRGAVYRLDPDGSAVAIMSGVTISNGIAWSGDGSTVYYVDSATQRVAAYDFDSTAGTLRKGRTLVEVAPEDGTPDGMTVDGEGYLWVAMWGGAAVRRYSPTGQLDDIVALPVRQVTACAFGGPNLDDLYVTTSREGLDQPEAAAGALFRMRLGITGFPLPEFAG